MRRLTLLGSTGSIGTSTLDVVRRRRDRFQVFALVAGKNARLLARQIEEFRPEVAVVATESDRANLISRLQEAGLPRTSWPELLHGAPGRVAAAVAPEADFVLSAIVGVAGLEATYEAVRRRKIIGLANKEVLVASGALIMEAARESGTELIPVDSEHNGAHQCLRAGRRAEVTRLYLTASGGPFRETPAGELRLVTPEQALNHPTWKMGPRITIDSATMMNKGFEVIEACWLFGFAPSQVTVVIHPQSSVHAMIEYVDGSLIAQISATDMRMPIQYALTYPERAEAPVPRLDWAEPRNWSFGPPDFARFPLLRLAYEAQEAGGSATCTLNAADEIAVESFLDRQIPFPAVAEVVEETLSRVPVRRPQSIGEVLGIDRESREVARRLVRERVAGGSAEASNAAVLTRTRA
ncbi:MAG: 1-deoxy-D-xylulose-5-phosphate reductoisomerase [Acidobacteria bacterium]|nr:1-deoxy-D-xylulose-5-phosphate reductoisomerase [Acidobacteriota bacterium]